MLSSLRSEVVIKAFHDFIPLIILIIHLHLLVLISNQFLNINSSLSGYSEPDLALIFELVFIELPHLHLQVILGLSLLLTHLILLLNGVLELLQIFIRWLLIPDDIAPDETTLLRFLRNGHGLVDQLKALWQLWNKILI